MWPNALSPDNRRGQSLLVVTGLKQRQSLPRLSGRPLHGSADSSLARARASRCGRGSVARVNATDSNHRVVIVGAGFGGLFAARVLRRAPVEVTVIDRTNHHLFQPLLYQAATGILSAGEIAPPTRDVLKRYKNVAVQMER
jgi:NADPH-dependent 2,4-dienoyl-CoA reductase/sulfur reductase-like enzyme